MVSFLCEWKWSFWSDGKGFNTALLTNETFICVFAPPATTEVLKKHSFVSKQIEITFHQRNVCNTKRNIAWRTIYSRTLNKNLYQLKRKIDIHKSAAIYTFQMWFE